MLYTILGSYSADTKSVKAKSVSFLFTNDDEVWMFCGSYREKDSWTKSLNIWCKLQLKYSIVGTPLVVQWLRIRLPVQRTQVWSLVREDPTCRGATKPMRHNYWACTLEPTSHNYWARVPQLLKPVHLEPVLRSKRSHRNE